MEFRRKQRLKELSKPQNILYKNRINRLTKNFERFFGGELNDAQVELLEIHARATIDDVKVRLNNRTMRQKVFLEFLITNKLLNSNLYFSKLKNKSQIMRKTKCKKKNIWKEDNELSIVIILCPSTKP